ncbi:uncharacterized protein EI97DRAFT_164731 [Westerdykella ornata]|uniref:Uncharacterized protein n=1 Tax=Westerdykella ornata TaxID=318751 RepID=A0A6A6JB73_WESOR|nr:uncharacterized protein EI97DRAFT_164731 [Westerdykella ornata]KAF2273228.1 hypothetical protein EI97DRAFT_164731 [Westerdykella ornata]
MGSEAWVGRKVQKNGEGEIALLDAGAVALPLASPKCPGRRVSHAHLAAPQHVSPFISNLSTLPSFAHDRLCPTQPGSEWRNPNGRPGPRFAIVLSVSPSKPTAMKVSPQHGRPAPGHRCSFPPCSFPSLPLWLPKTGPSPANAVSPGAVIASSSRTKFTGYFLWADGLISPADMPATLLVCLLWVPIRNRTSVTWRCQGRPELNKDSWTQMKGNQAIHHSHHNVRLALSPSWQPLVCSDGDFVAFH